MRPFIGQSVVAITDHSTKKFRQGDEFMVLNRLAPHCKCGVELIAIGIKKRTQGGFQECGQCGTVFATPTDQVFFLADRFAPVADMEQAIEQVLNQAV